MSALKAEDIPDSLLHSARHIHVASYFLQTALQPGLVQLFRRARELGLSTSLDTNYDPAGQWQGFDALLACTHVFLPNEKEACSLAGCETIDQAADYLAEKVETLALKLGAQGALGRRSGQKSQVATLPVSVVDTVGAGDSFDAGFIYAYLQGWPLEKALQLAAVCGALSTTGAGGTQAQPTLAQALAQIAALGKGLP